MLSRPRITCELQVGSGEYHGNQLGLIHHCRLAAVNFFLGLVGVVQCTRILMYQQSLKNSPLPAASELKEDAKEKIEEVKEAIKSKTQ